jgi:hypothetical protein
MLAKNSTKCELDWLTSMENYFFIEQFDEVKIPIMKKTRVSDLYLMPIVQTQVQV